MSDISKNIDIPPFIKKDLEAILQDVRSGKTDGINELTALLDKSPDCTEIIGHLAWVLAQNGRHNEAITFYSQYLKLQPHNIEVRWRIADRLVNLGKLDDALGTYREILKDYPDCQDASMGIRYINYLKKIRPQENKKYIPKQSKLTELQQKNLELNKQEFKEQRIELSSLPPNLYLESTTKCNFYCQTCSKGYAPYYAEDLQEDIFEKVRREVMPTNVKISITGHGEPTLAKNFDKILLMSLGNGSQVHFVTNGSLLNFKRIEQLTKYPVNICISVDGATRETFESIRSGAKFDLLCDKLMMIKKLRDIHLSQVYSLFSIAFVALKKNIHELADIVRLAHRYGIMSVSVMDYAFGNREFDEQSLRFDPVRANQYIEEAKEVARQLGVILEIPPLYSPIPASLPKSTLLQKFKHTNKRLFSIPDRFPQRCYSPWLEPYIHNNGIVSPCCATGESLGDLKKNTFQEIWNGWRYRLLRFRLHTVFPPICCRTCFACWGINAGNAGNIKAKEGLFIKILYYFEYRLVNIYKKIQNFINSFKKMIYRLKGITISAEQPNYYKGRPLKRAQL